MMKSISFLASKNIGIAQGLLIALFILIAIVSWISGTYIALSGFIVKTIAFVFVFCLFFLPILLLYPTKKEIKQIGLGKDYFRKWKVFDVSIMLIFGLLCSFGGNYATTNSLGDLSSVKAISVLSDQIPTVNVMGSSSENTVKQGRIRQLVNRFQQNIVVFVSHLKAHEGSGNNVVNTLLMVLGIIGYYMLLYVAAAIACGLACDGMGFAAVLLILCAQLALIVGFYFAIKSLLKRRFHNKGVELSAKKLRSISLLFTAIVAAIPLLYFILALL